MVNRSSHSMTHAIRTFYTAFSSGTFQTMTTDRGKEFSCHERLKDSHSILMYFTDPYSSLHRGINEDANVLLREFFPKKTDLEMINSIELDYTISRINNRPQKCLDWKVV